MPPEGSKPRHNHPDYRPEHELPAPPHQDLIREHEPETQQVKPEVQVAEPVFRPAGPAEPHTPHAQRAVHNSPKLAGKPFDLEPALDDIQDEGPKSKSYTKLMLTIAGVIVLALIVAFGAVYSWYKAELEPVSSDTTKHVRVTIKSGETPAAIATQLQSAGVIKSEVAFTIYTKFSHTENKLKAGTYGLQPSVSTQGIVDHLVAGKQDTFDVTFLPGDTLTSNRQKLIAVGYSASAVDAALKKTYNNSPLFDTKPGSSDLEGYFYGETNEFDTSASVPDILNRFFDEYNNFLVKNNIAAGFQKQGLTLYQGITLASIVQREIGTKDMPQVARVFLNRLTAGMTLGSDVTYQYAAKKLGVPATPNLDSPYNTRKYPGLPPGPIATPSNSALLAVANPASNNYLFFLSGDDGVTYYATTDAQHQQNILQHCQQKCSIN